MPAVPAVRPPCSRGGNDYFCARALGASFPPAFRSHARFAAALPAATRLTTSCAARIPSRSSAERLVPTGALRSRTRFGALRTVPGAPKAFRGLAAEPRRRERCYKTASVVERSADPRAIRGRMVASDGRRPFRWKRWYCSSVDAKPH
jgi:hypothetical protein